MDYRSVHGRYLTVTEEVALRNSGELLKLAERIENPEERRALFSSSALEQSSDDAEPPRPEVLRYRGRGPGNTGTGLAPFEDKRSSRAEAFRKSLPKLSLLPKRVPEHRPPEPKRPFRW